MIHDPSAVSAKPKFLGDGLRPVLSREKPSVLGPDLGMSGLNFSADHGFFAIKTWENKGFSHPSFRENQHPNPPVESNFSMAGDGGNSHHRSLRHQQPPIKRSRLTLHCPLPKIKSFQNTVGKCWEPSGPSLDEPVYGNFGNPLETPNYKLSTKINNCKESL